MTEILARWAKEKTDTDVVVKNLMGKDGDTPGSAIKLQACAAYLN
jgi:hypothetical protein